MTSRREASLATHNVCSAAQSLRRKGLCCLPLYRLRHARTLAAWALAVLLLLSGQQPVTAEEDSCECQRYKCTDNTGTYVYTTQEMQTPATVECIRGQSNFNLEGDCRYEAILCKDGVCECGRSQTFAIVMAVFCFVLAVILILAFFYCCLRRMGVAIGRSSYDLQRARRKVAPEEAGVLEFDNMSCQWMCTPCLAALGLIAVGIITLHFRNTVFDDPNTPGSAPAQDAAPR
eukprot:TRINITY_DN28972_c0_g1_i1.p1 TRINITY_DN28972_c0_g1~~TRINITY_DN28972_c0_g1_i1.p1  ORF type:complete len:232 (+),score=32.40 TRINITY_DN28972_c0_g1_i1:80-775(+)